MGNGMISHLPGVVLEVDETSSQQFLALDITSGTDILGKIIYKTDSDIALIQSDDTTLFTGSTVYLKDTGDFEHEEFSHDTLADSVYGYRYLNDTGTLIYDDEKNAPEAIDSFGLTVESA